MLKTLLGPASFNFTLKRFAGHSKWANIRHTKALKDGQRSQMFTRFGRQIKVAIQEGGSSDPSKNFKLERILSQAKRYNMPAATIQSIIKSMHMNKELCRKYILEIKGPGGSLLLCEIFTENLTQTRSTIATILRKNLSKYADSGVRHLFEEKAVVEGRRGDFDGKDEANVLETATEHAIEFGAEDVQVLEDKTVRFFCEAGTLKKLENDLTAADYTVTSATVEYVPLQLQPLSDKDLELCSNLCEKLEGHAEVVNVYDNVA